MEKSPLAPEKMPDLLPVKGFRLAVAESGIKYQDRPDLMLLVADQPAVIAGVLTTSRTASAPVDWCRKVLEGGTARAVFVNAGNANAFTGQAGVDTVEETALAVADSIRASDDEVLLASTGVIGEPLDAGLMIRHLPAMQQSMNEAASSHQDLGQDWEQAAEAIRTTDTFAKATSRRLTLNGVEVTITGIAKGSGMIAPDMATMLSFIATDAAIAPAVLQAMTRRIADQSFNAITVDSDTSTSDTVLVLASGMAGNAEISDPASRDAEDFAAALHDLMVELAQLIVRDGEGATKFITITVAGAEDDQAARRMGLAIANSPLVKTAIAGEDANWGRIVMAVGKSGEKADRDRLSIAMGGVVIAQDGQRVADYDETPVAEHMKGQEITIAVNAGVGDGAAVVWTCDLTHGYISINADYRS
ncbi:MAG: bifunctional ornithine acetyltransferase/N-acetylglutamate synthase [Gammaproteobacteria bacterium TMED183]|jgi:glutamate N-acetyltransferase/amino-acid N-acetyltransferase|nr:bifunctional ornithine acetyltransferase/N-acetylglutamate synthase [SAR116 cluster bacterium]OUW37225.1 MAG: bifunctional ornithine acetyltransferase/N-acetylglutamate synthase [Gammaproteobacteria bacterium TMED183]